MNEELFLKKIENFKNRKKNKKENVLEIKIKKYAESQGCEFLKLTMQNKKGFFDRTIFCPNGELILMEIKRSKQHKPTDLQLKNLKKFKELGFNAVIVHSLLDAQNIIKNALATR